MKVLEFSAPAWCAPCRTLKPLLEKEAKRLGVEVEYYDIDTDEGGRAAEVMKVRSVPTVIGIDDEGVEIGREVGTLAWKKLEDWMR